ncbi:YbcC family protein [Eilatimonas milleporae]|uniref:Probable inorganic carbon transporter subunit DabA n=1 Tax=Eilatimonas milleporae TaxID=911205 RepID=A0A3M0C4L2_9PROT|nr:DUF2309 domain-containing protein [Eilatimonas milleporae]RMB04791.1 hypothetical protein BXY39_2355 [Eilatimonas milleporae]
MTEQIALTAALTADPHVVLHPEAGIGQNTALRADGPLVARTDVDAAIAKAAAIIAPLWPLKHFVAVNPFLGLVNLPFAQAAAKLKRATGASMLMPRNYYRGLIASGRITDGDLAQALETVHPQPSALPKTVRALKKALAEDTEDLSPSVVTVAEILDRTSGTSATSLVLESLSKWCAAYWDEGQSTWRMPWKNHSPYAAWRAAAIHDRTPRTLGFRGIRKAFATLPDDPHDATTIIVDTLGLTAKALDDYFHRALASIGGWTAYTRYRGWHAELAGETDDTPIHLLAMRLAWDYGLFITHGAPSFRQNWTSAVETMADVTKGENRTASALAVETVLQNAFDLACQRETIHTITTRTAAPKTENLTRKAVQAAFCIDVRSEVYRRAFESISPDVETIGFAGFFGFPIEYVPIGQTDGGAQCPVLLKPKFVVRETVAGAGPEENTGILTLRRLRRRAAKLWKSFKSSAVTSFVYVETAGLSFAAKLVSDSAHLTRTVSHPSTDGLDKNVLHHAGPELQAGISNGRRTGFGPVERVDMAEAVLKAMSMTGDFARLVMLTGHGSTTVNNPHASGLDCGACGGHTGEANARVAAAILNDPAVRTRLHKRGIIIPEDTWFLGCLHDTTTDGITIFNREQVPQSHQDDLDRLDGWLTDASKMARSERAALLGIGDSANKDKKVTARSRDWSQVRPEWGLAGNTAFIAAPRARTQGIDLGGRAFLHTYDWKADTDWSVLELIMTAPMVVASWINLQYYGSTVDNPAFGSGNKVLHNVTGTIGVLEGNGGDLRTGLSWQSVHDGKRLVHEPLRLSVFIEAPIEEINRIIAKHESVRHLADNGWIHLFALSEGGEGGQSCHRYTGNLSWQPVDAPAL